MHGFRKRGRDLQMSSNEIAIKIEGLGKRYEIYDQPGDRLKQFLFPRLRSLFRLSSKQYFREFWALRDISFEVKRGETVGIIGRNGSGKSTLLQIICGTLTPTAGSVQTNGRIAALLELGSGFNPEFTGRENVYLNASVLGLTKEETDARFDDIVAFADIGDFIDQPTKTYSSGMMVRLAFAVIAHVDADILVVDEALAVGDAVFTQKCMRFIREFQKNGTLFFVSHDMGSVLNLCESAIWLNAGHINEYGKSKAVSESYLQYTFQEIYGAEVNLASTEKFNVHEVYKINKSEHLVVDYASKLSIADNLTESKGWRTGGADIISVKLLDQYGNQSITLRGGENISVEIIARSNQALESPILGFIFKDRLGQDLFGENTLAATDICPQGVLPGQKFQAVFKFRLPMLPNGNYSIMASVADGDLQSHTQHHFLHDALIINVSSSKVRWGLVGIPYSKVKLEIIG